MKSEFNKRYFEITNDSYPKCYWQKNITDSSQAISEILKEPNKNTYLNKLKNKT